MKRKIDKIYSKELRKYKRKLLNASPRILSGLEYIGKNYTKRSLSSEEIASYANVCTGTLSKLWEDTMGINIRQFINDLKIAKAKELLVETNLNAIDVAKKVGFEHTNFCRIFRDRENTTPVEYRRKRKLKIFSSFFEN